MDNIKNIDIIIKKQKIFRKKNKNDKKKIIMEYFIQLLLNHNLKTSRFVPKLYGIFKYKETIFFIMEKLKGNTLHHFLKQKKYQ